MDDKLKNVIETFKDVMDSIIMKQIICRSKVIFSIPIFHVVFETPWYLCAWRKKEEKEDGEREAETDSVHSCSVSRVFLKLNLILFTFVEEFWSSWYLLQDKLNLTF